MMGRQDTGQAPLFYAFELEDHVPINCKLRASSAFAALECGTCNSTDKVPFGSKTSQHCSARGHVSTCAVNRLSVREVRSLCALAFYHSWTGGMGQNQSASTNPTASTTQVSAHAASSFFNAVRNGRSGTLAAAADFATAKPAARKTR